MKVLCKESAMCPVRRIFEKIERNEPISIEKDLEKVTLADFEASLKRTRPSAQRDLKDYLQWEQTYGSL